MAKSNLSPEAKAAKAAYQRAWRQRNPEKVRQHIENYWERKAAEMNTPKYKARELSANGYTQRQIAEKLGVSVGTVNTYLNND
ncbi:MAG: response regulator transcription factor [Bacteroidales bacterium]|jgi:DNA-binding NarL/FixJ family response regulator|nr:response regulator transcription factor [Bacteroidales bacterium]